ncbi:MAG TPA: hypothetical protein PKC43_06010 [Phycisphaerales bacterium]|nr:hypothetical protein [Phycisphaerales bacterium]HMP36987.1 hypothetical protein [Phycisphaerales bacterium]
MERARSDPRRLEALIARGREAAAQRRWLEATSTLESARAQGFDGIELNRLLARSYAGLGGTARALDEWRRVLLRDPSDPEAMLEIGVALVDRRDGETALAPLLELRRMLDESAAPGAPDAQRNGGASVEAARQAPFHDLRAVAAYVLAEALWQGGFDLAGAESALLAVTAAAEEAPGEEGGTIDGELRGADSPPARAGSASDFDYRVRERLDEVRRRSSRLLRASGEALLRCGRCDEAIAAFEQAELHEQPSASQRARRLAAYRCAGRLDEAMRWWIRSLAAAPDRIEVADADLAEWLRSWATEADRAEAAAGDGGGQRAWSRLTALRDGARSMATEYPDHPTVLAVAAAVLPPDESATLFERASAAAPRDPALLGRALRAITDARGADGWSAAVALSIARAEAHPLEAGRIAAQLATVDARPRELLLALAAESSATAPILSGHLRVLWQDPEAMDAIGAAELDAGAAIELRAARHALRAAVAGMLQAPELAEGVDASVREILDAGELTGSASLPALLAAVAEAHLRSGEPERAWSLVEPSVPGVSDAGDRRIPLGARAALLATGAEVALASASALPAGGAARRSRLASAERLARAALVEDPLTETPWRVLLMLVEPEGNFHRDEAAHDAVVAELDRAVHDLEATGASAASRARLDPLLRRLQVQRLLRAGRTDEALALLLPLVEAEPADQSLAALALSVRMRRGEEEDALAWLRERAERMPSSLDAARNATDAMIAAGRSEAALALLRARQSLDGADPVADALLARALSDAGEPAAARGHERRRLERRPPGAQRELELARLAAAGGEVDETVERIERVLHDSNSPAQRRAALLAAVGLERLAAEDPRRVDALIIALAERTLADDPALPLSIHTAALVAEIRRGGDAQRIEQVLHRAISSPAGRATTPEGTRAWLALAQAMVSLARPDVAAAALRRRIDEGPAPEIAASNLLRSAALTADIAARDIEGTLRRLGALRRLHAETGWPALEVGGDAPAPVVEAALLLWLSTRWTLLDDEAGAEALLRAALLRDPDSGMAANNLGWMLLERDAPDEPSPETVALIERAAALLPDAPSVVDSLGRLRYRQGRFRDEDEGGGNAAPGAITLLRRAADLAGEQVSAEILDHLGDALWAAGARAEALANWRRAIETIDRSAPREAMLVVLLEYQQREHGLVLADPRDLYQQLYGRIRERALAKILAARSGE